MFTPTPLGTETTVATTSLRPGDVFRPHAGVAQVLLALTPYGTQQLHAVAYSLNSGERSTFEIGRRTTAVTFDELPTCSTCEDGCNCRIGTPGCGHYACWGQTINADACPGVIASRLNLFRKVAERRAVTA